MAKKNMEVHNTREECKYFKRIGRQYIKKNISLKMKDWKKTKSAKQTADRPADTKDLFAQDQNENTEDPWIKSRDFRPEHVTEDQYTKRTEAFDRPES